MKYHQLLQPSGGLALPISSRRAAVRVRAQQAKQQQRPVFIDDSGTTSFLDWARSQGKAAKLSGSATC